MCQFWSTLVCIQLMAIVVGNALQTPLPKFHDGNDAKSHVGKLAKGCVMNDEDTDAHKLQ